MRLISLDPGAKGFGVACWGGRELKLAFYGKGGPEDWFGEIWSGIYVAFAQVVIAVEIPQVYVQSRWRGDANDLIGVGFRAGEAVGYLKHLLSIESVTTYRPFGWKKNAPKDVSNERTLAALSVDEKARIRMPSAVKTLGHNVIDSIGIGLFYLCSKGLRNG
jgi:hypothetical protein